MIAVDPTREAATLGGKRLLVTGTDSFICSHLAKALVRVTRAMPCS